MRRTNRRIMQCGLQKRSNISKYGSIYFGKKSDCIKNEKKDKYCVIGLYLVTKMLETLLSN